MEALEWSPLDDPELDDNSIWFLREGCAFRVREEGERKVLHIQLRELDEKGGDMWRREASDGEVHRKHLCARFGRWDYCENLRN